MDYGAHLPLMDFGGNPFTLEHADHLRRDRGAARLPGARRQRPHGVLGAVARRADGPRGRHRALRDHDAGHDRVAPGDPRAGAAGQDAGGHRPPQRGADGRGRRPRLVSGGLRRRRPGLRGALASLRGVDRRPARPVAGRRRPVRRTLLLHRGDPARPAPDASRGPADLARQLGFGGRAAPHRPPGRRLAGFRVQHHPGALRRGVGTPPGPAARARQGPRVLPQRARDDVVLPHRRPCRSRAGHARTGAADDPPARGAAP